LTILETHGFSRLLQEAVHGAPGEETETKGRRTSSQLGFHGHFSPQSEITKEFKGESLGFIISDLS